MAQQRVERLAEAQLVLGLGRDAHAARARALQDRGVVRRELAVDGDAVERALDADAEQQVGGLGLERGVGLHEAEHRREGRLDHARRPWPARSGAPCPTAASPRATRAWRTRRSS